MSIKIFRLEKYIRQAFWSVIFINSALKKDENFYPQVLLKECKYIEKEKNIVHYLSNGRDVHKKCVWCIVFIVFKTMFTIH